MDGIDQIGYIVPLYISPTKNAQWYSSLLALKTEYPTVPMIVIANVADGAGSTTLTSYATEINAFRASGIIVLGYVYTSDGKRNLVGSDPNSTDDYERGVEQAIAAWSALYSVDGIFLDNGHGETAIHQPKDTLVTHY